MLYKCIFWHAICLHSFCLTDIELTASIALGHMAGTEEWIKYKLWVHLLHDAGGKGKYRCNERSDILWRNLIFKKMYLFSRTHFTWDWTVFTYYEFMTVEYNMTYRVVFAGVWPLCTMGGVASCVWQTETAATDRAFTSSAGEGPNRRGFPGLDQLSFAQRNVIIPFAL